MELAQFASLICGYVGGIPLASFLIEPSDQAQDERGGFGVFGFENTVAKLNARAVYVLPNPGTRNVIVTGYHAFGFAKDHDMTEQSSQPIPARSYAASRSRTSPLVRPKIGRT